MDDVHAPSEGPLENSFGACAIADQGLIRHLG